MEISMLRIRMEVIVMIILIILVMVNNITNTAIVRITIIIDIIYDSNSEP